MATLPAFTFVSYTLCPWCSAAAPSGRRRSSVMFDTSALDAELRKGNVFSAPHALPSRFGQPLPAHLFRYSAAMLTESGLGHQC
eukprot:scaffold212592_cov19-Tisochrysis_lutea.AAC.1